MIAITILWYLTKLQLNIFSYKCIWFYFPKYKQTSGLTWNIVTCAWVMSVSLMFSVKISHIFPISDALTNDTLKMVPATSATDAAHCTSILSPIAGFWISSECSYNSWKKKKWYWKLYWVSLVKISEWHWRRMLSPECWLFPVRPIRDDFPIHCVTAHAPLCQSLWLQCAE